MTEPAAGVAASFDLLHPAVQHHVVNSLGWRSLRPLQEVTIGPILAGEHAVATAPTAGGKTEAAVLLLLSRMLSEDWRGLSVLYICPLRALLNNLYDRLEGYGALVGRRVGLWHGDIGQPERRRLLADPPDVLLTTPESLESMLVSRSVDHERWFAGVRAVVVDEVHDFAGDDRGWHLLAVLERVGRLAGREIQRIGLSATLGNPDELLAWMTSTGRRRGRVVSPPPEPGGPAEVTLDYVGSLANAAVVISRLHRGEKRLVFVDSRARVEQLALTLREHGVTTYVSHGSLGAGERRAAEEAFSQERDCVIVATSTLELGIDVGDLDRMIQVDAPPTVAAFLQRLGRTGRRAGTRRTALMLATSDDAFLRATGVLLRWAQGYVEPIVAPPLPLHLVAQQLLALSLQEAGIGRRTWPEWLGEPFVLGTESAARIPEIVDFLVGEGFLSDDGGILGVGGQAEASLGRQHFMELLSVFTSPPVFSVRHGRVEIGVVPDETLTARPAGLAAGGAHVLVLAGRSWAVLHVDWSRRVVQVEPTDAPGVARWAGSGQPLGSVVARGIREVLAGADPGGIQLSERAGQKLAELRALHPWATADATTVVVHDRGRARWWTFAGWKANLWLARIAEPVRREVAAVDDLTVAVDPGTTVADVAALVGSAAPASVELAGWITAEAIDGLKFSECLPRPLAAEIVAKRLADPASMAQALAERLTGCHPPV
ncbi:MAG: DEAD/DEAH box helicase [Acidimicrobiales bacterium]